MPQVYLSAFAGAGAQFFDNNGIILTGGKISTYTAGTTTPAVTYTSSLGVTPHTNPIILDSAGRVPGGEIWLPIASAYKFVVETSTNVLIGDYDNIGTVAAGSASIANFTGNGSQTVFTLPSAAYTENATNVYINGVYQQKNTYSVLGAVITFSTPPPLTSTIEVMYF